MFKCTRSIPGCVAVSVITIISLSGCAKKENAELDWARAALERNPNVEIVATDEQNGVFTLRDKHNGEVRVVGLGDLAAAPVAQLTLPAPATAPVAAATPAAAREPVPEAAPAAPLAKEELPAPPPEASTVASAPTPTPADARPYTIERTDGQLKVSGPGISVVSTGTAAASTQESQASRTTDPIICEGRRMLHLDNRNIYVEGDAITVRGGCELYITNSNIVASGTGVIVHDGTVHISNSYVEGASGSFEADSRARVFVRGSTFQGLSRRDQLALVQDQGGNRWR